MGYRAETHFKASCEAKNFKWENASKEENCNEHIDCHITSPKGIKFTDVKAAKKLQGLTEMHRINGRGLNGRLETAGLDGLEAM